MKKYIPAFILGAVLVVCLGATIVTKISDYPRAYILENDDKFVIARGATNYHARFSDVLNQLGESITKTYVTNYSYTTNYYTYGTNYYITDENVSNYFTTNIFVDNTVTNYFQTNILISQYDIVTNTSIYEYVTNNSYVSNFFATNIFTTNLFQNDTYVSNFFQTNLITNIVNITTNLTSITTNIFNITTNLIVQQMFEVYSNAYFYNNVYVSNAFITNLSVKNLTVQSNITVVGASTMDNITVTNGVTNLSLTASQYVATDANKRLVSTRDLSGGTNLFLTGITSPTNAYGSGATIDFAVPESTTNISNPVTFTGMANWNATNYNRAIVWIVNFSGSDRTITIPAGWGNDIARLTSTTYTASNGMVLGLFFSCQLNQFTNCNSLR